ncbi:MAG: hypothetical protein KAW47_11085 [Thermoplasmatales archaeon]|nr:hypothetical protein [Thermoplasmatales archaeon]
MTNQDSEFNLGDEITVYLKDTTCTGKFLSEDKLGLTLSKETEKGVLYLLIPWEGVQWIEWLRINRSCKK